MGKATRSQLGYFFDNISTFAATGLFLMVVTAQFTFAQNTSHKVSHSSSSSPTHRAKSGASVGCSNHGLPCSSAPAASGSQASGTQSSQYSKQLSQIEHEKVTPAKTTAGRSSTKSATPSHSVSHTSAKAAPPINFSYRAPHNTATTSTKSH